MSAKRVFKTKSFGRWSKKVGWEKNQPGDDFTQAETEAAKGLARAFERADGPKLNALLAAGVLLEICHEDK